MTGVDGIKNARARVSDFGQAIFRLSTLLGLLLIAFLWIGTFLYLRLDREKSLESAVENTSNTALLLEEELSRSLKEIDQTLQFVRHSYQLDPARFDLATWASSVYLLQDFTVQLALIGPDGRLIATNIERSPEPVDLSDREHFRVHLGTNRDDLFMSRPVLGRATHKWTIQLTRRIAMPDGSFGGVIVASIDPYYLSRFFGEIDLGGGSAVTLVGTDGIVRARSGLLDTDLGRSIDGTDLFDFMTTGQKGSRLSETPETGEPRLTSFRRLDDFPLILAVEQSEKTILAGYSGTRSIFLWTTGWLTIVLMIVIGLGNAHELRLVRACIAQRDSEKRVFEKSLELEATLHHTSQGILMVDRDRNVRVVNPPAVEFLSQAGFVAMGLTVPDEVDQLLRKADAGVDGAEAVELSFDNGLFIAVTSSVLPDSVILYTLTDITQHKRTEAVLADARDRAEAGSRARAAFLATMSHEIRTPLNGVIGMTHLLEDCADEDERRSFMDTMRRSAGHVQMIIEDILDLSKLEADRMTFEFIALDIEETIRTSVGMIEAAAIEKRLTLQVDIDPRVPKRVMGDPGRLRQVLLNLLGNAVKFTPTGTVSLTVDIVEAMHAGAVRRLRIRVSDTGIGIAADDLVKLFQDFSQIDGSITRRFGGTGLGLAISQKLAENMGGDISVTSQPGIGSTFTVLLPISEADAPLLISTQERAAYGGRSGGFDLLLVEDSPINATVATKLLEKLGHRVTTVIDGVEAIDALARQPFDAVFMDIMMPRMDGLTATRLIRRSHEAYADVPIIALTAAASSEDREKAFAAGVSAFTTKPVSSERLKAALDEATREASRKAAAV